MAGFYRDVVRVLQEHGCVLVRQGRGDHEIWHRPITDRTFPVDKGLRSRHTANAIMKQAGIDHSF